MHETNMNGYCQKCRKDYAPVFPAMGCPRCHRARIYSSFALFDALNVLARKTNQMP